MQQKNKKMNYKDLKQELGVLIHESTYENFYKGYDPISDLISDKEEMVIDVFELNIDRINSIKIGSSESYEIMNFLIDLKPGDPYYKKTISLDFYGNVFFYSKYHEDLFNDFGKKQVEQRTGFLDFTYHYLLDDFIMTIYPFEEENEIQACLDLVEDDWGIFEDEN
jgi:hypothetical protein